MLEQRLGTKVGPPESTRRRVLVPIVKWLPWIAAVVYGSIVVVSFRLSTSMDLLFREAVIEGRVFPYTGEAEEQALLPAVILLLSALCTLVTLAAAAFMRITVVARPSRVVWMILGLGGVLLALLISVPVVYLATIIAQNEISQELYPQWYVPVLIAGISTHAAFLIRGAIGYFRPGSRR